VNRKVSIPTSRIKKPTAEKKLSTKLDQKKPHSFTLSGDKSELNKTPKHRPPYYPNMYSNKVTATTDRSVDGETQEPETGRK
jgi:hypothetical protein